MKIFRRRVFEIAFIIAIGFIPFLWFRGNEVILGHDAGLPLSPLQHFIDRLYTWTVRFGFGNDQTYALPGIFIHGLEALLSYSGFNLQQMQKISFVFWFVLPGLSMYYLASRIEERMRIQFLSFFSSVFYMINHFLLQGWFVAERTKFSVYAALPIFVAILIDWSMGKTKTLNAAIIISILFFFLNGLASLPLFGGVFIVFLVFVIVYFFQEFSAKRIRKMGYLIGLILFFSILLQAYWLFPFVSSLSKSYGVSVDFFGGKRGILDWVKYVSENSSYSNLLRLQGVPEWYQNPLHPYASVFLNSNLLIIISSVLPIMAFTPLLIYRKLKHRWLILLFSLMAVISLILVAGAHPPFGVIYVFLMENVPGFIAFRNPFYKFSSALWLSYAILIGLTISLILTKINSRSRVASYSILFLLGMGIILYSYPFLNGSFFDYIRDKRSNRVAVPEYIFDFGKWSETEERVGKKTLVLPPPNPDGKVEEYRWGYWSLAPLSTLLTNSQIINNSLYVSKDEDVLLSNLYYMMETNQSGWQNLARILGIDSFVLRKDFVWDNPSSPSVNPKQFENALFDENVTKIATFGKWEVYDLKTSDHDFSQNTSYSYVSGDINSLVKISTLPGFLYKSPLVINNKTNLAPKSIKPSSIYLDAKCIMCDQQWKFINTLQYTPTITQGSLLYPFISNQISRSEFELIDKPEDLSIFYAQVILRNILGFQKSIDLKEDQAILDLIEKDTVLYSNKLHRLLQLDGQYFTNDNLIDLLNYIRTQEIVIKQIVEKNPKLTKQTSEISNVFGKNSRLIETISYRSANEHEKKFLLNTPVEGEFEVYYRPNDDTNVDQVKLYINGLQIYNKAQEINGDWYSFGKHNLKSSNNRVMLDQLSANRIIFTSVNINKENSCFYTKPVSARRNEIYKLSFDHFSNELGSKFFVAFIPSGAKVESAQSIDSLTSHTTSRSYETMYAVGGNSGFQAVICNRENLDDKNDYSISIENLNLRKVAVPDLLFVKQSDENSKALVAVTRKDNTSYSLKLSSQNHRTILTFMQSFNQNWITTRSENHIVVNGFANGWIMSPNSSDIIVEYKVQKLFRIGILVSLITLIFLCVFLFLRRNKK